jgi:MinD superfamily P-loop ATPase
MKIAFASGKGGTGKTTLAVNLASVIEEPVQLLDCDVEEPNCHIFLPPEIRDREPVCVPVPSVIESRCSYCGECTEFCEFHAIVSLKSVIITFPELCHGCGGCAKVCPEYAILEVPREIGTVEIGSHKGIEIVQGRLQVGQAMPGPVIRAVKKYTRSTGTTIVDCPPGNSCPLVAAVKDTDIVVLVTEPTPFGLHDLKIAVETVRQLGIPLGVVINRSDAGDRRVAEYCAREDVPLLLEIPEDRSIAEAVSLGKLAIEARPGLKEDLKSLHTRIAGIPIAAGGNGRDHVPS